MIGFEDGSVQRHPFREIVGQLPCRVGDPLVAERMEACLQVNVTQSSRYIWPDVYLNSYENAAKIDSPILLVSAPGAMGKSVAARAVAAEIGAPLIDLSSLSVGSDTLTGLLARVLGWTQAPQLITDLRSGKAAIVLDGLDEAQLRAGREHTVAFLENIIDLVTGCASKVGQVIMFGRRDAIETSYLAFSDANIEPFMSAIAPLTREQSYALIDVTLSGKGSSSRPYDVHKTHPLPFAQLRDTLFRDIAGALGAIAADDSDYWDEVGDFLGYPPVLLVFAERLAVDNPAGEIAKSKLESDGSSRYLQHGDLLREVVEGILDRESEKVRQQISQALSLGLDDRKCSVLYTREEQTLRILKYASGRLDIDIVPPVVLSNGERTQYEDLISNFVPDHPFLNEEGRFANVVFADYVRAFVAIDPLAGVHGLTKTEVIQACEAPGPFFAGLVYSIAEDGVTSGTRRIAVLDTEDLVDDLIKSYFSGTLSDSYFTYAHSGEVAHLSLYVMNPEDGSWHGFMPGMIFKIRNPSGVLELTSPLSRGSVFTASGVVLNATSDEVELGPAFVVLADELQIRGRRLIALGERSEDDAEPGVVFFATTIDHEPMLTIHSYPARALQVASAGNLWHIWRRYAVATDFNFATGSPASTGAARAVLMGVRRILTSFRRTTASDPSIYYEWLDHYGTGSNPVFVAVLEGLIELGIVQKDASYYRLRLAKLSEYGVNYAALRGADFASTLRRLIGELWKTDSIKRVRSEHRDG